MCGPDKYPDDNFCKGFIPEDCVMSDWSSWSTCSRACVSAGGTVPGGETPNGTRQRSRTIVASPTTVNGVTGAACPANRAESEACNTVVCAQDCVVRLFLLGLMRWRFVRFAEAHSCARSRCGPRGPLATLDAINRLPRRFMPSMVK